MNETSKTVAFLITGCLFAAAAASSWWMTQPKPVGGYEKVGEEFFPEFADAQAALSVEVIAFDDETDDVKEFSVAKKRMTCGEFPRIMTIPPKLLSVWLAQLLRCWRGSRKLCQSPV